MDWLDREGLTPMSASLDEVPMVYKNIHDVMAAQHDLVEVLAQFDPKLVKMAPAGERSEDKLTFSLEIEEVSKEK